jgi:pimeloyl-ACP methyl ester carboxylesterase
MFNVKKIITYITALFIFSLTGCGWLGIGTIDTEIAHKKYMNEHSKFINVDGIRIHYREEGNLSGETVVLLHGILSSLHTWDKWTEELKKEYRVIRFDLPGFGLSHLPLDKPLYEDVDNQWIFFNKVFKGLHIEKAHFVGNSLGGYLVWNYAVRYPEMVQSLTVIDPMGLPQKMPSILKFAGNPLINPFTKIMYPKPLTYYNLNLLYGTPSRVTDEIRQRYSELAMIEGNKEHFAKFLRVNRNKFKDPHLSNGISSLKMPVLVLWGEKDPWFLVEQAHKWKQLSPHSKVITYPTAGHMPMEEVAEKSVADFIDFTKSL